MKSELNSPYDKYADLIHIRTLAGDRFFTEDEMNGVAMELSGKSLYDLKHEELVEKFKDEYFRAMKSPLELIGEYEHNEKKLKEIFEGYPTSILKLKDKSLKPEEIEELVKTLNENSSTKVYQQFTDKNAQSVIIERSVARRIDIGPIVEFMETYFKPMLANVK